MKPLTIDHVIITRFNVPTPGLEGLIRAKEGWLKDRVQLFEKYCQPSVQAQTVQDFHWLVYFDPDSPQWLMDWISNGRADSPFTAVFRSSVSQGDLLADLARVSGAGADVLLTTNLDNDDGLAVDFVRRLQGAVVSPARTAIYLSQGLIQRGRRVYLRADPQNAFCSVAEPWERPATAWADWHNRLGRAMPVVEIAGSPAWLQLVHDRNVSNTVHGRLCTPSTFTTLFPTALNGLPNPSNRDLLADHFIFGPLRSIKTQLRTGLRIILLRALGKNGFNFVKNKAANVKKNATFNFAGMYKSRWSQARTEAEE